MGLVLFASQSSVRLNLISITTAQLLAMILMVILCSLPARASELSLAARAAVLMDVQTGKILWEKNKDLKLPPASTAKIMTALVVLEQSQLEDIIGIPIAATLAEGSTANLQGGERISVRDLLYALLIHSANDAAIALASHVGGSVTKFVDLMNRKARLLGAIQTEFFNPTGLTRKGQVTTARDLAVITRAAMANSEFRKIVATKSHPWQSNKWQGELKNSNELLENYRGAIGVKTGSTRAAGHCVVAAAERGDQSIIAVVLNSREKALWQDVTMLLNHGFNNFTPMSLLDGGETIITSMVSGKKVPLVAATGAQYVASSEDLNLPQMQIELGELEAPIAKGEKVGEAVFHDGDKEIARVDLVSKVSVPDRLRTVWLVASGGVMLLAVFFVYRRIHRRRNRYIFAGRGDRLKFR
jgi:serine-type D-Ala-D-Ala carboxypeptidase (penicillin-binding protein 5/6)